MRREYEISSDGLVAISPKAAYCQANQPGKMFETFLNEMFKARLSSVELSSKRIEVNFIVGGLLQLVNQYTLTKEEIKPQADQQGPGLDSKKATSRAPKGFKIELNSTSSSTDEAYQEGKQLTQTWYSENKKAIALAAIACIDDKFKDTDVRKKIKIELYDPNGEEKYSTLMMKQYDSGSPDLTISIRVNDIEDVWGKNKTQFSNDLMSLLNYFERGRLLVEKMISSGNFNICQDGLIDAAVVKKFESSGVQLQNLQPYTKEENEFLRGMLHLTESFHGDQATNPVNEDFDSKSIITFMNISLAALDFFNKKNKNKFSAQEKIQYSNDFLSVYRNNQQYILLEVVAFYRMKQTILYPQPKELDVIQMHVGNVVKSIFNAELNFGFSYKNVIPKGRVSPSNSVGSDKDDHCSSDGSAIDSVDDLIVTANQMIRKLIKQAVAVDPDPLLTLKMLYLFISWYKLALTKVCSEKTDTKTYLDEENLFWNSIQSVLDKVEKQSFTSSSKLTLWKDKVRMFAADSRIMGCHIADVTPHISALSSNILTNEIAKDLDVMQIESSNTNPIASLVQIANKAINTLDDPDNTTTSAKLLMGTVALCLDRYSKKLGNG